MPSEHHLAEGTLECREVTGSPGRIVGVILPAGRIAGDRREIFIGSGISTPASGVRLLPEHRSKTTIMSFDPIRDPDGTLKIDHRLPDSPEGREAAQNIRNGTRAKLSVEFHSLASAVVSGVREVRESLVEAVALVGLGSYNQARAEVRHRAGRRYRRVWQ